MQELLRQFHQDERGATATEYVILLILVACFVIAAIKLYGSTVSDKYNNAYGYIAKYVDY